jgi:hypothetical protein
MNNKISRDEYDLYIRLLKNQIEEINQKIKVLPDLVKESKTSYEDWYKIQLNKNKI